MKLLLLILALFIIGCRTPNTDRELFGLKPLYYKVEFVAGPNDWIPENRHLVCVPTGRDIGFVGKMGIGVKADDDRSWEVSLDPLPNGSRIYGRFRNYNQALEWARREASPCR